MCLDRVGRPIHISVCCTAVEYPSQLSALPWDSQTIQRSSTKHEVVPCPNQFKVKEKYAEREEIGADVFRTTPEDNMLSMSQDDRRFMQIMNAGTRKNHRGNWEIPLPFRTPNIAMPNNRPLAVNRLNGLLRTFKRKPKMKEDYFQFMSKIFDRGHAVPVPQEELLVPASLQETNGSNKRDTSNQVQTVENRNEGKIWYLPHFGVYHPRKPDQIRVVFDSSAEYQGVSLNKELLPGPDLMNSLSGMEY